MTRKIHISETFGLLKPVCDSVVKQPTKENLQDLEQVLPKLPPEGLLNLQDYVLYPLELNLKRPNLRSETRIYLINCIKQLLHYTSIKNVTKFFHLYSLTFFQLFDKSSSQMVAVGSEELKLSVIQCATKVLQKCSVDIASEIYVKANIPRLSQGIFMCVQVMQKEKLRPLRIAAVQFLIVVTRVDKQKGDYDDVWRPDIADVMMYVVPGMLSALHRVALGDEKQGHFVTLLALRAWSRILALVLEDITPLSSDQNFHLSAKVTERLDRNNSRLPKPPENNKNSKPEAVLKEMQNQRRTPEWAAGVAENVSKMVENLRILQQHSHWKVRQELVDACHLILEKCHRHFLKASLIFMEILMKLADDETHQVASKSQSAIEQLAKQLEEESGVSLYEILEENFYALITKLPRVFHVESDEQKLSELRLLKQSIQLLGAKQLPLLLQSAAHLERTLEALLQVVELHAGRISLLEDCSLRDLELNQDPALISSWKQFKHFSDKNILEKLQEVLRLLGKYGDLEVLCNHLLDLISVSEHRNEVVYLLNEILVGGAGADGTDHIVKNVLKLYLSEEVWYVPLSVTDSNSETSIPAGQARANLQLACLLVEGVGCAATGLGNRFQFFVMHTLYPVVERAGSPHESLAAAGLQAAAAVAKAMGQGEDITSLLATNMDYFMMQVTLRLRRLHENAGVLCVLSAAMKHSSQDMLPYLQDAVSDVLLKSCDKFQSHHTSSFLQVFYTFFISLKKWFVTESNKNEQSKITKVPVDPVAFLNELSEYCRSAQISREEDIENTEALDDTKMMIDEEMNEEMLSSEQEEEKKPKVPAHVEMTVSILQRCLHFLPGKDRQCRLLALEALQEGLEVLRDYEDQLLPIAHQVWSPLVRRLQDTSDALLLNRSFLLLCTLARLAKDFLRARTLKQVMPPLCQFLLDTAAKSQRQDTGSAFRFTQLFKLQLCLLEGLGPLVADLQLQEKELYQVLSAGVLYLGALQPQPLQEMCVKMLKIIADYDGDAVWLEMVKIQRQMTSSFKDNKEYIKNTETVLEYLHSLEDSSEKDTNLSSEEIL